MVKSKVNAARQRIKKILTGVFQGLKRIVFLKPKEQPLPEKRKEKVEKVKPLSKTPKKQKLSSQATAAQSKVKKLRGRPQKTKKVKKES